MSVNTITCPTDCSTIPNVVDANYCSPDTSHGEIDTLLITALDAAALTNFEDLAELNSRINNTGSDPDVIRRLNFIGEKPEAEGDNIVLGGGYSKPRAKTHTLTGTIVETGDNNYALLKKLECGGNFKILYAAGKYIWGGNTFVSCNIEMKEIIPLSRNEEYYFAVTITWTAEQSPDRGTNPFA